MQYLSLTFFSYDSICHFHPSFLSISSSPFTHSYFSNLLPFSPSSFICSPNYSTYFFYWYPNVTWRLSKDNAVNEAKIMMVWKDSYLKSSPTHHTTLPLIPLTWYLLRILDTHPWDTRSWREMTQGRIPAAAISTILSLMWLGRGRPLMYTPPSWLTLPWPAGEVIPGRGRGKEGGREGGVRGSVVVVIYVIIFCYYYSYYC